MSQWNYQYTNSGTSNASLKDEHDYTTLLEDASKDELQQLMDNEDKINQIVLDDDKINKLKLDRELIQAENRSIADHNLSKEPILKQMREELVRKYGQLRELKETFQANQARLDSLHKDVNLETMLAVLQTTCAETEEQSEAMAESLLQGDILLADFLSDYKTKRTLAHMRRIKTEKMRELVLDVQRNPMVTTTVPPIPSRIPVSSSQNVPPYPGSSNTGIQSFPGAYPISQPPTRYPTNAYGNAQKPYAYNWGSR